MAQMTLNDMAQIIRVFSNLQSTDAGKALLKGVTGNNTDLSKLEKAVGNLKKDFESGGYDQEELEDFNKKATELKKQNYEDLYNTYKPKGQILHNVVTPVVTGAARIAGNGVGIYQSALAALLANSAKGLNHSSVTDNLREGAAGLAPIYTARGAFASMLGNSLADTIQKVSDKYKADDEVANRQAYAASNPGTSGTMYYNLDRSSSNE